MRIRPDPYGLLDEVHPAELAVTVDDAMRREYERGVNDCLAIVLRRHSNDYSAGATMAEIGRLMALGGPRNDE